MNTSRRSPTGWRFSLRELLMLLGFVAVGCAALKYAGEVWVTALSAIVLLLFMLSTVVAVIDRGHRQALAIGFALCVAVYGVLFWSSTRADQGNRELDPHEGRLPTTKLLKPLFTALVSGVYIDSSTGKIIPNYNSANTVYSLRGGLSLGGGGGGFGGGVAPAGFPMGVYYLETPPREKFMAIGHLLWALLLGYTGARLAGWIYARRQQERDSEDVGRS